MQIAFTPFVQVADLGGALLVSFLMFWVAEAGVRVLAFRERRRAFLLPVALFGLALGYGVAQIRAYSPAPGEAREVVLVQGNISLAERLDIDAARRNLERHHDLSRSAARPNALIVWPEGSIPAYCLVNGVLISSSDICLKDGDSGAPTWNYLNMNKKNLS